jgi:hypothetical protein
MMLMSADDGLLERILAMKLGSAVMLDDASSQV